MSYRLIQKSIVALFILMGSLLSGAAFAGPGCVGKMWNPITDVDFRLMGGIRIAGVPLMKSPKHLGSPPDHKVNAVCFCKNGWKTGFGLGLTYWLPTYLADVAREAGCIGFLKGTNILPGFISLSSGQEYSMHQGAKEGTTSMQVHWAFADITAIVGAQLFEECQSLSSAFSIAYMTEPDFVFQNDVYSAIMSPHVAILASNSMLSQMACGAESVANTLGGWQDFGICGWSGTRLPLSANTISTDMAQVTNMDVMIKYLTRSSLLGTMLRTMGKDTACKPKWAPMYNAFQHRYQWAYPSKVSTRYNVNVVRWGLFVKPDDMLGGMKDFGSFAEGFGSVDASTDQVSGDAASAAKSILANLPKPLNYPTRESGYMQVWEAKTCCMMVLTLESVAKKIAESALGDMSAIIKDLYDAYEAIETVYTVITNPVGAVLGAIGDGITSALGKAGDFIGDWAGDLLSGAATVDKKNIVIKTGPSAGIAQSAL